MGCGAALPKGQSTGGRTGLEQVREDAAARLGTRDRELLPGALGTQGLLLQLLLCPHRSPPVPRREWGHGHRLQLPRAQSGPCPAPLPSALLRSEPQRARQAALLCKRCVDAELGQHMVL